MTLLLVFPPFTDASQPASAIPSLAAAVRDCGIRTKVYDANLESWEYLLNQKRQELWLRLAQFRLRSLDHQRKLDSEHRSAYLSLLNGCLKAEAAIPHLSYAMQVFRSNAFFVDQKYRLARQAVCSAFSLISAIHHPARLDWGRFWPAQDIESAQEIIRACADRRHNPFLAYTRLRFIPAVRPFAPRMIGISLTYLDQVVPAMTLARECRRIFPKSTIVFGGQVVSLWGDSVLRAKSLWPLIDIFVQGEGESALRGLVKWVQGEIPLGKIPNLIAPTLDIHTTIKRESIHQLPCPDYSVLPLKRYLAPKPVLLLSSSRGCYWGKCEFCAVSPGFRPGYRVRESGAVFGDIRYLSKAHNTKLIMFGDDSVPPLMLRALADGGKKNNIKFYWQAEVRWDAIDANLIFALAQAGARNLIFGLESGNADVLRRMRKGTDLEHAQKILNDCKHAGIGVNLQCFLGFPGESVTQALDTLNFLSRNSGENITVSCGEFQLFKDSPIWRNPAEFVNFLPPRTSPKELTVQLKCPPIYGCSRQRRLLKQIESTMHLNAPQLCCGISAHALIYLASGKSRRLKRSVPRFDPYGIVGLTPYATFRRLSWDPNSLAGGKPKRKTTTVAFCLDSGALLVLGHLSDYIIHTCKSQISGEALLAELKPPERGMVLRRLRSLARKGLIGNMP